MGAWKGRFAGASVPLFLPHNFQGDHLLVVLDMQMDAHFKKEQIGTLFISVGALEGGV